MAEQDNRTQARTAITIVTHPLDSEDAPVVATMRSFASSSKGLARGIEARKPYDALTESVSAREDVSFESGVVGNIPGVWVHPANPRAGEIVLHLHGGWFNLGTAHAYRHLVGQIAARSGADAFIPDYRLAPEHPFPAAVDDVLACYRGLDEMGFRRIAVTGDSAGGNLALVLASSVANRSLSVKATLVGVVALSPVTDLSLSGETYETRAEAEPYFTRPQVAALVSAYLGDADPKNPLASPLYASLTGLRPVRVHVGDDEVLLDDSRRYVERAVAAGVDARLDIWMGMAHGFVASIGQLKAAALSMQAVGGFLTEMLQTA